jgi:hypothetical protein
MMLTALALVASGAHLAALPNNKMAMAQAAAQLIYAGWALFGMKSSRDSVLTSRHHKRRYASASGPASKSVRTIGFARVRSTLAAPSHASKHPGKYLAG